MCCILSDHCQHRSVSHFPPAAATPHHLHQHHHLLLSRHVSLYVFVSISFSESFYSIVILSSPPPIPWRQKRSTQKCCVIYMESLIDLSQPTLHIKHPPVEPGNAPSPSAPWREAADRQRGGRGQVLICETLPIYPFGPLLLFPPCTPSSSS